MSTLPPESDTDVPEPPMPAVRVQLRQPADVPRQGGSTQSWMVTFTDLVALMLTFFVLLYSMSRLDEAKWQNLTSSLSRSLDTVGESELIRPKAQLSIRPVSVAPGADLGYLGNVLNSQLRGEERLSDALLRDQDNRLVLSLPGALVFDGDQAEIGDAAQQTMFALGGVLRTVSNSVEIIVYGDGKDPDVTDAGIDAGAWTAALARAVILADLLRKAGYAGHVHPRGLAREPASLPESFDAETAERFRRRVDIVVLEDAGERP